MANLKESEVAVSTFVSLDRSVDNLAGLVPAYPFRLD